MIARNPNTGGTIRVLKSEASIWKNKKTLTWKQVPPTDEKEVSLWSRWDTIVCGIDSKFLAWNPQIIVLREDSPAVRAWLATKAKDVRFILISSKVVDSIGQFQQFGLGNVMCLEELSIMYPFIGQAWDGTAEDAILCAALIFRYSKIVGLPNGDTRGRLSQLKLQVNLSLDIFSKPPEPLTLIQQYYVDPKPKRAKELYKCLVKNLECPLVDKIILCMENINAPLPPDPLKKLLKIPMKTRITYAACIEVIKKHVDPATIVVFANTDIYLDETWRSMWSVDLNDVFVGLLRWEEPADGNSQAKMFGPRSDSQDTWALYSNSVFSRIWDLKALDIPFGKSGCDNAILVEFLRQKFKIVNPALSLRTLHVHHSEIRNYVKSELVDRPVYMHVDPTGIHELNPIVTWDSWAPTLVKHEPLHRPLNTTNPKALAIFCSQMNRNADFVWSKGQNSYLPPVNQDHIISLQGAFVSPSGLVYRHNELYVGNTEIQKRLWSENTLSHLIPSVETQTMMAFPLEPEWLEDPALYTLYYLSKAIKQHQETPEASMWCKQTEPLLHAFKLFKWNETRGRLMQYTDQTQVFAEKVVGRTSHGVRIMPADVTALRANLFNTWKARADYPVLVLVSDAQHITGELLADLESYGQDEGYSVRVIPSAATATQWAEGLLGASRVILSTTTSNTWAWLWMAPKECLVLELQEERAPSDKLLHLCAAGGQDWTLLQYPRSTAEGFKKIVMAEVGKWFKPVTVTGTVPTVIVPPKTMKFGFFGHKGDSFREMVDLWEEKGYVEKQEDPAATLCWLHGIGQTLLYDRPTWAWLEKAADAEKTYKVCLAGNPEPVASKPWIFWPRQPRLVERLAATLKPIEERKDQLVFFGRIENDVQASHRQNVDQWRSLCTKFSMPLTAKEPYALAPEEYLMALQNSKYGLCLRGYGPKCNREIELLAMGTVPLVTDGVDYSNYADPLIEGLHVIYVKDAQDAKVKMAAIPDSQWETMSKAGHMWWKKNASVDGSWSKTKAY